MHEHRRWIIVGMVALFVLWLRLLPLSLVAVPEQARSQLRYRGEDGAEYVYLAGVDGYLWARHARNYLRHGTTCDALVEGECRDTYANAPVGARMIYNRSLHIAAIVGLHKLATFLHPAYPLLASTFLVQVVVGALGVLPAFFIGCRLAGNAGGLFASVLSAVHPVFLSRSIGGDNDVWNVVLPLFMMWAAIEAGSAQGLRQRISYAMLAGGIVGLQAATWNGWSFSYLIFLTSLTLSVLLFGGRYLLLTQDTAMWRAPAVRHAALTAAVFYVTAGISTSWVGAEQSAFTMPLSFLWSLAPPSLQAQPPVTTTREIWPQVLTTVGELQKVSFSGFMRLQHGVFFFIGSLVGLALLTVRVLIPTRLNKIDYQAALMTLVWFFAALYLSTKGIRFLLLVGPPVAFTFAVAAQHGSLLLGRFIERFFPGGQTPAQLARSTALAAVLVFPTYHGVQEAEKSYPQMTDAWWDTFTELRNHSAADAIINLWWDYGHWAKYVAERRVSGDGASLATHVHHWLGKALVTSSEKESIGLLRMLNCGSDATPLPEGRLGAYDKILRHLADPLVAHDLVAELASLDETQARLVLQERAFSVEEQDDILHSTHCEPPEAYLVLSTEQTSKTGSWLRLGLWNFRAPETTPTTAAITPRWLPCRVTSSGDTLCTGGAPVGLQGRIIETVLFNQASPSKSMLRFRSSSTGPFANQPAEGSPGVVIVAGMEQREEWTPLHSTYPRLAILVDAPNQRALVGSTSLVRSQFLHLLYLNGRYAQHFEKLREHTAYTGERVVTWKIHWHGKPSL